jgi:hypothetical protein
MGQRVVSEAANPEWLETCFVMDMFKNIFAVPIGPEHNEALLRGEMPVGGRMVSIGTAVNPEFHNLFHASLALYQMAVTGRDILLQHADALDRAGTPGTIELSSIFQQQAANFNLVIRQANEGYYQNKG